MKYKRSGHGENHSGSFSALFGIFFIAALALQSCNLIKQFTGASDKPLSGPGRTGSVSAGQHSGRPGKKSMEGYWKLAFSLGDAVQSSHIKLNQDGDKFSGEGTDDDSNKPFFIENGLLKNGEVVFYKRYEHPDNPNSPPVEYSGTLDTTGGSPYMSGKFLIATGQQELSGDWEAQMEPGQGQEQEEQPQAAAPQSPPPAAQAHSQQAAAKKAHDANPDKPPDISGKWTLGYEYQFKVIHSTMFLEQVKDKFTGHGFDENTNESFQVEKGWYSYPKITIIRKYPAIKTKKVTKPERRMIFKGDVSWVDDKDYAGPYMSGKTEGGGSWEAQRVY